MIVAAIKARRPHLLPHRKMEAGETLARMQFASEADFRFFANHLRWSAFGVDRIDEVRDDPAVDTPVADAPAPAAPPTPRPKARR